MVGDFAVQTDWQASCKFGGLGADRSARRALVSHLATYTLTFVPALVWVGKAHGAGAAVALAGGIAIPHLVQDDGRLLDRYMRTVKGLAREDDPLVPLLVDQSMHAVALLIAALIVGS
jgi:hypothetical protein